LSRSPGTYQEEDTIPQALLPLIADGAKRINHVISVVRENGQWTYFCGVQPVFQHAENDRRSFRMFTAQLICQGACRLVEITRAFGVSKNSVIRSVNQYRAGGVETFFAPRATRGASVMTPEVTARAQQLLWAGRSRKAVAEELGLKLDTLRKAIQQGRLTELRADQSAESAPENAPVPQGGLTEPRVDEPAESAPENAPVPQGGLTEPRADEPAESAPENAPVPQGGLTEPIPLRPGESAPENAPAPPPPIATDKSTRAVLDAAAEMGTACTRPDQRVLAAFGLLDGAPTRFETCRDVPFGGVLCALPALEANGLFRHIHNCLAKLRGYYSTLHVIVLLAHMALCRIKTVEQLQYQPPGELGKLLGLDRVPEVRCLRSKLAALCVDDGPKKWAGLLSKDWLKAEPELAGALYVDGHVRLYHGNQTALPKRYVSRQRLCLRGTTDYWVNDILGRPFFAIERPIDQGLLEVLETEIVPRLLKEVPGQPTDAQLATDRYLARFVIVFDREGYSPAFFKTMWQTHRIACITYHKYPKDDWPVDAFAEVETTLPNGERVTLRLAERGTWIGDRKNGLWVREIRKRTASGHQVSLISTAFGDSALEDSVRLFSRWSQENFFRYMMQHFAIDLLNEYGTEEIPETKRPVVNPKWRELDRQKRSVKSKLTHRQARFAALTLHPESDETARAQWEKCQAELVEEIDQFEQELTEINAKLKTTPGHLAWDELPETDKFQRLAPSRKQLVDTVKMIAYRAETALASIVREELARSDDARSLLRDLFRSAADLLPDLERGVLSVQIHPMSNPRSNRAIAHLLEQLNAAEFNYPGTHLRLVYSIAGQAETPNLVPHQIPTDQEV
jgi:transposase